MIGLIIAPILLALLAALIVPQFLEPSTSKNENTQGTEVEVNPIDCGPLAREEFGVVFSAMSGNEKQTYFVKGRAMDLCPKILENSILRGVEYELCRNYTPENPYECDAIKEFVL